MSATVSPLHQRVGQAVEIQINAFRVMARNFDVESTSSFIRVLKIATLRLLLETRGGTQGRLPRHQHGGRRFGPSTAVLIPS